MKLNLAFFGTPEFAAIVLGKLIEAGYLPEVVVTNPDEPAGRRQTLAFPPAKILAEKNNIPVFQPQKLRDNLEFLTRFKNLKSDLAIVAAYGKIIPKEILEIPKFGFINIHGSILPKYRGPSPIQAAILNGDKVTGVTIMKIDEEMDHGPILGKFEIRISKSETYESLSKKLADSGAEFLIKIIPDYISGKIKPVEQNHSKATYTKIIKKEDGKIGWSKFANEIERMVRGYYPWPTAWTKWDRKILKIIEADVSVDGGVEIGKVIFNGELTVKCGGKSLIIKKLQLEGGKILNAKEFLNGHKDFVGSVLK